MSDGEWRFGTDEVGEDAEGRVALDPWTALVGLLVAAAGVLLLVQPWGPFEVFGRQFMSLSLATVALTAGFGLGAVVFYRRGERTAAIAHGVGALGWGVVVIATGLGSVLALFAGLAVVIGGVLFLVAEARHHV